MYKFVPQGMKSWAVTCYIVNSLIYLTSPFIVRNATNLETLYSVLFSLVENFCEKLEEAPRIKFRGFRF